MSGKLYNANVPNVEQNSNESDDTSDIINGDTADNQGNDRIVYKYILFIMTILCICMRIRYNK